MNTNPTRITVIGVICVILTFYSASSHAQTNKSRNNMDTTLKMQCQVKGEGEPLLLVGGGLTGWKSWEPFVEVFNTKQRRVILVQLISVQFGLENRQLPADYSVKMESKALAASLDSLGVTTPIDIVAWSFGGLISLDYALDHSERIKSLTLIEPPAIWVLRETGKFDDEMQKNADFFLKFRGDITEEMLEDFLKHAGFVPPGQSPRNLPQWAGWVPFRNSLRNNPFVVTHEDSLQRLKKFQPPVLLVKGTGSTVWLHNIIDGLSENIPHSRVSEFPGGHAPHLVSKERFLLELEKFQKESR
jgi:pimeloyl-ACP methyl ester carboxylesterase